MVKHLSFNFLKLIINKIIMNKKLKIEKSNFIKLSFNIY